MDTNVIESIHDLPISFFATIWTHSERRGMNTLRRQASKKAKLKREHLVFVNDRPAIKDLL